jgi:hypothetical protein
MSIEHFGASTKAVAKYKKLHANEEPLGDAVPDDPGPDWHGKREGRPQKPPAGGDTTWREWAERTKGSRAEMDAGIQHPGHTAPRGAGTYLINQQTGRGEWVPDEGINAPDQVND